MPSPQCRPAQEFDVRKPMLSPRVSMLASSACPIPATDANPNPEAVQSADFHVVDQPGAGLGRGFAALPQSAESHISVVGYTMMQGAEP